MVEPWVLLAEDNDDMRALLARVLHREGFRVVEAEDGFELADSLGLGNSHDGLSLPGPALVLADIHMPGRSGLEVISEARAAGIGCPVAILSAFVDEETIQEAHRAGVNLVLAKPTPLEELGERLRALLKKSSTEVPLG